MAEIRLSRELKQLLCTLIKQIYTCLYPAVYLPYIPILQGKIINISMLFCQWFFAVYKKNL